jgi:hypothetical protein
MPKQAVFILSLLFALIVSFQCKKPKADPNSDNGLPPATQEGKNVFACKVNGQPWISQRGLRNMGGGLHGDTLSVFGTKELEDGPIESLELVLLGTHDDSKQVYKLNDTTTAYAVYTTTRASQCFNIAGGFGGVVYKKVAGGQLTITKADPSAKIIAGTFSFTVPRDYCDTLKVTEGRFDVKYYP